MTTVTKLLNKTTQFNSQRVSDYVLTSKRYYTKNQYNPVIEELTMSDKKNVTRSISMKRPNGVNLNILEANGEYIKVLRDRLGEVLAYKSNINFRPEDLERVYKNTTELVRSRLENFLTLSRNDYK